MGIVANDRLHPSAVLPAPSPAPRGERRATSRAVAGGLTVAQVLQAQALRGAEVVAGAAGLGRRVERLGVMEVPDILPWVKPHELLLTTGYPLRDTPDALVDLVAALDARGLAALGVKPGRYLERIPPALLAEADRLDFPVVRLPDDVAFDDVLEQVLSDLLDRQAGARARSEQVHQSLVQIVLDGGGLPELARELAACLGAAVLVTTTDGRVLADAGSQEALAAAYSSRCFEETGRFRVELERAGVHGHEAMAGNHVVLPVLAGGVDHGRIVAHSHTGALDDDDVQALERAATVAALTITKQLAVRAVESKYQGDFLRDLVSGRVGAEQAVSHSATLGWDVDRPVVVVVAELDPASDPARTAGIAPRPALERFASAWQSVIRQRDTRAPVAGFSSEVVAVLRLPPDGDVDRFVRDLVREVSGDGGGGRRSFTTGVSRISASAAGIPAAYEQARKAVRVGRRMHGAGAVAHFDGLGIYRLLSLVEDGDELASFVRETLRDLATSTDPDLLDLRRTLEVLLDTNCNVAETARTLHYHYNTLRYRIGKLERMLGAFMDEPHLRLDLQVALRVVAMRGL